MEWITLLKGTPVPTILILAGIFFLLLAVAGGIAGKINILPGRQSISLAIGVTLLIVGIVIYLVPTPAPTSASAPAPAPTSSSTSTPTPTAGPATGQSEGVAAGVVQPKPAKEHLDLLSAARGWPMVEKDDFSGSETMNWCQGPDTFDQGTSTRRISDGAYRWELKLNSSWAVNCAPVEGESLNDFYVAVDAKLVSGPSDQVQYGLQLRVVGAPGDQYYVLLMTDNQYWEFARWFQKEWKNWGWVPEKGIHPGEYNRLEVVTEGTRFHFYINGESAGYIDDDAIPLGRVGLIAGNSIAGEAVVDFDNFELRKKPE